VRSTENDSPLVAPSAPPRDRTQLVRARQASVRARLTLATDALAVMDLLLAMRASTAAIGAGRKETAQ
jgi:hypothetical protein